MDLSQSKLSKAEWDAIEVPVSKEEELVLNFMCKGFHDPELVFNRHNSLALHLKIQVTDAIENFLYKQYFEKHIEKFVTKYGYQVPFKLNTKVVLKAADRIRIQTNSTERLDETNVYEYLLLDYIQNTLKYYAVWQNSQTDKNYEKFRLPYFTLYRLQKNTILNVNKHITNIVLNVLELYKEYIMIEKVVSDHCSCLMAS